MFIVKIKLLKVILISIIILTILNIKLTINKNEQPI